jgi:hypothetical protein
MHTRKMSWAGAGLGLLFLLAAGHAGETVARSVAIVRTAAWSQGDPAKEGAAELMILLEIARLRHEYGQGGLVAVGDRRGLFSVGAEEALRHAVLQGLPVVKLASNGRVLPAPHGLFLDGGGLSEEEARQVLARCLERYGPLGSSPAGDAPLRELRARLQLFQQEFTLVAATRLAAR